MKKGDVKYKKYINFQGYLGKYSSMFLIGYQTRYWKIFQNGTKIGYCKEKDDLILPENTFCIEKCFATEAIDDCVFELQTSNKILFLKASNKQQRNDWIKAVSFLTRTLLTKKKKRRNIKQSQIVSMVESDEKGSKKKKKQGVKNQRPPSIQLQKTRVFQPQDLQSPITIATDKQLIDQLLKQMPSKYLKYNTLLIHLKSKQQGIFIDTYTNDTYLLISSKSLYPNIHIDQQNLNNKNLPSWIQINRFYKIFNKNKKTCVFQVSKIVDVEDNMHNKLGIKVNMGEVIYQFFTETVQQKQCLKNCLQIAGSNANEVNINGKMSIRNFDKLINIYELNREQFKKQIQKLITQHLTIKSQKSQKTLIQTLLIFMDNSMRYERQFIEVMVNKKKNYDYIILQVLKQFHQQIKKQTKITWDSSFDHIKGIDILNILKKLSEYYQFMKQYIKSTQFLQGMKQLSKIYVRDCYKNFQSIIISIVQQQKKGNILQDQFCQYIQTNGVIDLFKFIYNVFDLAYPHWKNKIHLHNVNKLTQKALQIFINQLRSTIDQQLLAQQIMIGIANNYFSFKDYVNQFYLQKFSKQLAQKTQQSYQKIISNYRQVSMIVLDKIVNNIGFCLQNYFNRCTIQTINPQSIQQILLRQTTSLQKNLHIAFLNKLYQKISYEIHKQICLILIQQIKNKKKLKIKQNIRYVNQLRTNINAIFQSLNTNHTIINKKIQQIANILYYDLYSDIQTIIASNNEAIKVYYLKILQLRDDFRQGSTLHKIIHDTSLKQPQIKRLQVKKTNSEQMTRQKHDTLSGIYFMEQIQSSDYNIIEEHDKANNGKFGTEKDKLISQGYLTKGKRNKKVWEKEYFRLKNQHLYIFQSADSDRCSNAIEIKNVIKIDVLNPQKPSFLLTYQNLGKQKQIKLKADSIELRQRWVYSIELQRKRLKNQQHVKRKAIKHRETTCSGNKKYQMIIDYWELDHGKDYFSYSN